MTDETPALQWQQGRHQVELIDGPAPMPEHTFGPLALRWTRPRFAEERNTQLWQLVHLPTDRVLTILAGDPDQWKPGVERLAADFDWNFTDPACALKINERQVHKILQEVSDAGKELMQRPGSS
jgi:hypothetical protein